ncbi:MAG: hypothetical protein IIB46_08545 [Nitrospinae bacterium]|nr:hypothetical protein [Nitrospinota bacterium]
MTILSKPDTAFSNTMKKNPFPLAIFYAAILVFSLGSSVAAESARENPLEGKTLLKQRQSVERVFSPGWSRNRPG